MIRQYLIFLLTGCMMAIAPQPGWAEELVEKPAATVDEWVAQIEASLVQITDMRVEANEIGLQVVLETAEGSLDVPETRVVGNALVNRKLFLIPHLLGQLLHKGLMLR